VSALLTEAGRATEPAVRREVVSALARLYNTEGPWNGEWWGTYPTVVGPYFTPVTWQESARIKPVLRQTMLAEKGDDFDALVDLYTKNRVLPMGAKALFLAVATSPVAAQRDTLVDALVGTSQLAAAAVPLITRLDATSPAIHTAVAELLAGEPTFEAPALELARTAVLDTTLASATRAKLLTALAAMPGDAGRDAATAIFARLMPRAGAPNVAPAAAQPGPTGPGAGGDPIEAAWRGWVGGRLRANQLDYFVDLARSAQDPAQRTLAYAVLLQGVRNPRAPAAVKEKITPVLDAAWADPAIAPRLVDAISIMRVESQYTPQLEAYRAKQPK